MHARSLAVLVAALIAAPALAKDDISVRNITDDLDKLDKKLADGNLELLSSNAWSIYNRLELVDDEPDLRSDPRYGKLVERWRALGAKAAAVAGGHSKEILGDGKLPPYSADDGDRKELYDSVERACEQAANTSSTMSDSDLPKLKENYAKYEKALARALKADPLSVRHNNGQFKLFECEWKYQQRQLDLEDNANRDDSKAQKYKTCGYDEYSFKRLKIGGRWGAWELSGIPASNGYPLDCKKHPKANRISGNMPALIKQEFRYGKGFVWAVSGQPTTEQEGLKIYQYQAVRVFGKEIEVSTTDCGDKDPKVVCEASGSKTVRAYNAIAHLVARAELHRDAGRVERCKRLYKEANHDATEWTDFYNQATKSGDWAKGLKYKTRSDGTLTEAKIVARVKELAEQADERSVGAYCAKK